MEQFKKYQVNIEGDSYHNMNSKTLQLDVLPQHQFRSEFHKL